MCVRKRFKRNHYEILRSITGQIRCSVLGLIMIIRTVRRYNSIATAKSYLNITTN